MPSRVSKKDLTTTAGHECASLYERDVLQGLIDNGVEFDYEPETIRYRSRVRNGHCGSCGGAEVYQERSYTPDLRFANGVLVEIKGKFLPQKRTLMREVVRCHPELDLRFLFQRDGWLQPKSRAKGRRRYSDWARGLHLPVAIGLEIPEDWYA